jgi:ribonuclease P protein component
LQRQYRLKKDVEFKRVRSKGRSWANSLVVLYALRSDQDLTRVGISVSKRIGKAVKRNRVKRLIREVVRLRYPKISQGWDLVFIARRPIAEATFVEVGTAVEQVIRRAGLLVGMPGSKSDAGEQQIADARRKEVAGEQGLEALHEQGPVINENSGA